MSSSPKSATSTNINNPWSAQEPYLKDIMQRAQALYQKGGPNYYADNALAAQSENTLEGQQRSVDYAKGAGQDLASGATGAVTDILNGKYLSADSNPYLSGYTSAAIRPISQQFTESVLPNIRSDSMTTGGFGGSRQGIAEGLASGRFAQALGDTTSGIYNNAYNKGMDVFSNAISQAPGTFALGSAPAQLQQQVGEQQQLRQQAVIDADKARWDYEQYKPYAALDSYKNFISGNYGGTNTTTAPVARGNMATGALGGAAAGASVAGPWGALAGAILGAIGSR
jgi:hypothetical protein